MSFFLKENNFSKNKTSTKLIYKNLLDRNASITVVIPTFKRVDFIVETLESLDKQTNKNFKVLVIDNNDDFNDLELLNVLKKYKELDLKYYKNKENLGMTGNWNRGIELADTEWISILHDDDYFELDCIEKVQLMIGKYNVDMIVGKIVQGTRAIYKLSLMYIYFYGNLTPFPGVFFKKSKAEEIGGFNNDYFPGMDYIFWVRYIQKYKSILYDDKLANYRLLVNESSKVELQEKYIELDYLLKKEISNKKWYRIFNNYLLDETIVVMEKFRQSKLDRKKISANLKIKVISENTITRFILKVIRKIIKLQHKIIRS